MQSSQELRSLGESLWCVDHEQTLPGRFHMPTRMAVVRLPGGGLWLHSPVPIDDRLAEELAELGPVRDIVAREWANARRLETQKAFDERLLEDYEIVVECPETAGG